MSLASSPLQNEFKLQENEKPKLQLLMLLLITTIINVIIIMKNRIRNMGIKRASPEHMFATLAFGLGQFTRALDWRTL